jgi:hypothetical protein
MTEFPGRFKGFSTTEKTSGHKGKAARMGIPDRRKAGRSSLVPFRKGESGAKRHARRHALNLQRESEVRRGCQSLGLTLQIKNDGHHWCFSRGAFLAEWWPSSAKLVINKQWENGIHCHDHQQVLREVQQSLHDTESVSPATNSSIHSHRNALPTSNVKSRPNSTPEPVADSVPPCGGPRNARLVVIASFHLDGFARGLRSVGLFVDVPRRGPGAQALFAEPRMIADPETSLRQLLDAMEQLPDELRRQLHDSDSVEIQPGRAASGQGGGALQASMLQRISAIGASLRVYDAPIDEDYRIG